MEIHVLGPVELSVAGESVDLGPPRQRAVLGALAVDAGRPVPIQSLVARVWDDAQPERARHSLYVYIARLRRILSQCQADEALGARIVRRSGGYLLDAHPDRVDAHRFRLLADQAGEPGCPDGKRVALLWQALQLWRGDALADIGGDWAVRMREGLHGQRVAAAVGWARAQLRLGAADGAAGYLADFLAGYPYEESLVEALMRALYAVGRGAEALDRYEAIRRRLAEHLGADPGPGLRALHQAILRGDVVDTRSGEAGVEAAVEPAASAGPPPRPAALPPAVPGFVGRRDELSHLDAVSDAAANEPTGVVIAVLSGPAGAGKTALAVHWAHRVSALFPDGQLYVNLRGFDPVGPPMPAAEAVRVLLDALGVPPHQAPPDVDAQTALYRARLAGRRMLVVLDNAYDAGQVRALLPNAPGSLVVVTSRSQMSGLAATDGGRMLGVGLLEPDEARALLAQRLGAGRLAAEPDAVAEIVRRCVGLPLALTIVAARAAAHPSFALSAIAAELAEGLDAFDAGDADTNVRAVFAGSYRTLGDDAARLFRLLGLHPGPDIAAPAAASLAALPLARARRALRALTGSHLVDEHVPGRYAVHDLLRGYAGELVHRDDPPAARRAARRRLLDHYLHSAVAAERAIAPERELPEPVPAAEGVVPALPPAPETTAPDAKAWLTAEYPALLAAVELAARYRFDAHAWQLASALMTYQGLCFHRDDLLAVQRTALACAERTGDLAGQANAHRGLGRALSWLLRYDEGRRHHERSLELCTRLGDRAAIANSHLSLGWVAAREGDIAAALDHAQRALDTHIAIGDRVGQAKSLNASGWYHGQLGNWREALSRSRRSLELFGELGLPHSEAFTWDSLGSAHDRLGDHAAATVAYRRAVGLFQQVGDRFEEAASLTRLGDAWQAAGDRDAARAAWRAALARFDELGRPEAAEVRTRLAAARASGDA
jgi:DNA-binding SARP family transcriptional activator